MENKQTVQDTIDEVLVLITRREGFHLGYMNFCVFFDIDNILLLRLLILIVASQNSLTSSLESSSRQQC